ncbi:MAG: FkbM family methyltransferase [Acetobacteraceae bacterium]|jgi:FkbM family methyltransferase
MSVSHEWATHTMRIADRAHDIRYRPSTSDEKVINQICQEGRYDLRKSPCWNQICQFYQQIISTGRRPLIIDGGANIGAASWWFSLMFPEATVISVEPAEENLAVLRENALPPPSVILPGALSSVSGWASVVSAGGHWAYQTVAIPADRPGAVRRYTLNDILAQMSDADPFIVKVDIEGFEADLFSANTQWVGRTPIIITELHNWLIADADATYRTCMVSRMRSEFALGEIIISLESEAKTRDVILYRARRPNPLVVREVRRLRSELPDVQVRIVSYQVDHQGTGPGEAHYIYGKTALERLPYSRKLAETDWTTLTGSHDLPVLQFWLENPNYSNYWIIEDDVRYSGSWGDLFGNLNESKADLLMTVVQDYDESPEWQWWSTLAGPEGEIDAGMRLRAFTPFCRLSHRQLLAIHEGYSTGWTGHFEAVWPTVARAAGLRVEEIGGRGRYTPESRQGKHYWNTPAEWSLFPGSFIYQPWFRDMGRSRFMADLPCEPLLWHPVKAGLA